MTEEPIAKESIQQLVEAAYQGMLNTFAADLGRGSKRHGAAVLTNKGNIYSGCSYKSDTRSLSLHAEQVALAHAACHGEFSIEVIAIISDEDQAHFTYPCGMCKQLLYETQIRSQRPMYIVVANLNRDYKIHSLHEIIGEFVWPRQ